MDRTGQGDFEGTERYLIQRRLGRGGFGVVYQAFDRQQNAEVALKTLHRAGADALYRFKREFRALADISHPNLVSLYDLVSDGRQWFFTMELVAGVDFLTHVGHHPEQPWTPAALPETFRTLSTSAEETTTLPPGYLPGSDGPESSAFEAGRAPCPSDPARLRAAARQLAEGLCALHLAGKLHRDIKPSNVLVTREGRVVILDFGLIAETVAEGSGLANSLAGTPAYLSPEQCAGMLATEASDWYAVGIILFEALTGRRPFTGTTSEVIAQKRQFEARQPSAFATDVPEELERLCRELLRRDPQMRPAGKDVLLRLGAPSADAAVHAARAPFLGRQRELAALREALECARQGRTMVAMVHGTSGIGKSALVNHFLDELRGEHDVVTLAGRCFERESVPYKAFDSAIDLLTRFLQRLPSKVVEDVLPRDLSSLVRLFPALKEMEEAKPSRARPAEIADPKELRQRAFAALRELLARLSQHRVLVLFIDDLQWGDADSAALLSELLRPPAPLRLLLVTCHRTEEAGASPLERALSKSAEKAGSAMGVSEMRLEGLPAAESESLAVAVSGRRTVHTGTSGSDRPGFRGQSTVHQRVGARAGSGDRDCLPGPGDSSPCLAAGRRCAASAGGGRSRRTTHRVGAGKSGRAPRGRRLRSHVRIARRAPGAHANSAGCAGNRGLSRSHSRSGQRATGSGDPAKLPRPAGRCTRSFAAAGSGDAGDPLPRVGRSRQSLLLRGRRRGPVRRGAGIRKGSPPLPVRPGTRDGERSETAGSSRQARRRSQQRGAGRRGGGGLSRRKRRHSRDPTNWSTAAGRPRNSS